MKRDRVFTRGDFLQIAPNSPDLLKPWRLSYCNMDCGEHWDYSVALTLEISQKALEVQEKIKFKMLDNFSSWNRKCWNNVSKNRSESKNCIDFISG